MASLGPWRPEQVSRHDNGLLPSRNSIDGSNDDDLRLEINLRFHLDEIAELEGNQLRRRAIRHPSRRELTRLACHIYDARRARDRLFDRGLFGEPAWDMLLALYCLPTRGELLTVTSLALASAVPQSTGYRWQTFLTEQGLIERGPVGVDLRKQFMRLTEEGRRVLETYLTRLFYCDTPVPPHPEAAGG